MSKDKADSASLAPETFAGDHLNFGCALLAKLTKGGLLTVDRFRDLLKARGIEPRFSDRGADVEREAMLALCREDRVYLELLSMLGISFTAAEVAMLNLSRSQVQTLVMIGITEASTLPDKLEIDDNPGVLRAEIEAIRAFTRRGQIYKDPDKPAKKYQRS